MLETLISSKTRIKLLLRLFLNPGNSAHLRGLADDFGESTNSVRMELNRFEDSGMLLSESRGNKKLYRANEKHPLFGAINNILLKYVGIDRIVEIIIDRLGNMEKAYLTGDYAKGKDSGVLDLILVGEVNKSYLARVTEKAENLIGKKIRYLVYTSEEWDAARNNLSEDEPLLLLWEKH